MIEDEDIRNQLCERFRQSLAKPVSERFFDEEDLVEIFDYAGDLADDYLKMEVLLCGARLYPDSELLRERRAIFYSTFSADASVKYLDDNAQETSPIWEIMRIRARAPQGADAENAIQYLLGGVDKLDDEEVIQLVELASQLGIYDWLMRNDRLLREKCEYIPILLYEMAVVSEINHNYEKAVRYLEELTEAEPFNAYYWYMLAQDYDLLDQREKAFTALDYSLAIDPEGKEAMQLRARLLLADEATQDKGAEVIKTLAAKYPDDAEVQRVSALISLATGNVAQSRETMRHCLDLFPGDRGVLSDALAAGVGDLSAILDRFYRSTTETDEATWLDWADDLRANGYVSEARSVLEAYLRNSETPFSDYSIYLDVLFFLQDFKAINRIVDESADDAVIQEGDIYANIIIALISKLKENRTEDAKRFAIRQLKENFQEAAGTGELLERISSHAIATQIMNILKSGKSFDWQDFDPFGIWSTDLPF
ncbi:MAG: hypothetical protein K2L99_05645 [Muribaculaceae bacterium]|nr:hypothetical protein [Muribaculaceae bacterium]